MINILANTYTIDSDWCFTTLQNFIKKDCKIAIIPFSFKDDQINSNESWQEYYNPHTGIYYSSIVEPLNRYGIDRDHIQWINYFSTSHEEAKKCIQDADVLYFTGGLPDKMVERLHEFDLVELIESHNGVLLGFSAGALIQLTNYHLTPDEDYSTFGYYKGLRLINDFFIEVHFEKSEAQMDSIQKVLSEKRKPVYAIEEDGAIVVNNGEVQFIGHVHQY